MITTAVALSIGTADNTPEVYTEQSGMMNRHEMMSGYGIENKRGCH